MAKSTHPRPTVSKRRKRTEATALKVLTEAGIPRGRRRNFTDRIRAARQPVVEARRIAQAIQRASLPEIGDGLDFSDIQEIRVRLIRRDGGLWPPQTDMLANLDRLLASGELSHEIFENMAVTVLGMPQALPRTCRMAVGA